MAKPERIKVLIAEHEGQSARRMSDHLKKHGFDVYIVNSGVQAQAQIAELRPRFVIADLMLPERNAIELLQFIQSHPHLKQEDIKLLVMSAHSNEFNVRQAFRMGAVDYLVKPLALDELIKRLAFHCRKIRRLRVVDESFYAEMDETGLMLHLIDLVLREALSKKSVEEILFALTKMVSIKMEGVRCSIVNYVDSSTGIVVTSNDNRSIRGRKIDLAKYPEILQVVNTERVLAIEDLDADRSMAFIKNHTKEIDFNALVICPVRHHDRVFGVLSLRLPPAKKIITDNEIRFVEIVSHVVSLILNGQDFSRIPEFWKTPA